jgi:addiction module HigA family antidote
LFEIGRSRRIDAKLQKRCMERLDVLNRAADLRDLDVHGYALHPWQAGRTSGRSRYPASGGLPLPGPMEMPMMSIVNNLIEAEVMASYPARPRKRPPSHPGSIIADALDSVGISMREAARAIGMSPNGLNKVLTGKGPVTPETALRITAYIGATPELWLGLQADYDLWHAQERLKSEFAAIKPVPRAPKAA